MTGASLLSPPPRFSDNLPPRPNSLAQICSSTRSTDGSRRSAAVQLRRRHRTSHAVLPRFEGCSGAPSRFSPAIEKLTRRPLQLLDHKLAKIAAISVFSILIVVEFGAAIVSCLPFSSFWTTQTHEIFDAVQRMFSFSLQSCPAPLPCTISPFPRRLPHLSGPLPLFNGAETDPSPLYRSSFPSYSTWVDWKVRC